MKSYHKTLTKRSANRKNELEITRSAYNRLSRQKDLIFSFNVPILGRCADLVYLEGPWAISVEFKLRDWRRAILQARDHRLAANYAYVCLPRRRNINKILPELRASGVGLFFYTKEDDWPFETVEKAPLSYDTWNLAREELGRYLIERNRGWI